MKFINIYFLRIEMTNKMAESLELSEAEKQKKQYDTMTKQPIGKLLVTLSIPTIISMMVTNIYNIVDTAFVGVLGTSESGATGVVFGYMAILQAIAFMCGQGGGSLMSRRLGEKKLSDASKYTSTAFFLSFFLGFGMAIISFLVLDPLVRVLGSTETIAPFAKAYIVFILLAAPFFTSSLTMNNLLRYEGKAVLGTVGMLIGSVLNIGLDALLMFGLKLGIAGAGIATAVSQIISFSILLRMFLRKRTQTKISIRLVSRKPRDIFNVLATGFPSLLRQSLFSVATMLLNGTAGVYGDAAVSAMSIVSRISFFPMAVAIGIGQGFQPISSFNYGAGKKHRVRQAFWAALFGAELALLVLSTPIAIFAPYIIRLLRDDAQVVAYGVRPLRLMCAGQLFVPLTMMVEMGFQSTGARLLASFGSSLRSGLLFIPMLLILSKVRGMSGIQEAQPVSLVLTFFVCIYLCRLFLKRVRSE
ncbi:MAG: MATE family efflux transporter [bacterium]|nr:MATE family efflux transporter [bacterium]